MKIEFHTKGSLRQSTGSNEIKHMNTNFLINLAAGKTPISWSKGLKGAPSSNAISSVSSFVRSEANGA